MKKLYYLLVLLPFLGSAQIISVPDTNFKAKLLEANTTNQIAYGNGGYIKIDANSDGEIQDMEAQSVDSLNVYNAGIQNLSGIAGFSNLKKLDCASNEISTLDVSSLQFLELLNCSYNVLTALDVSELTSLQVLQCSNNQLTALDVSSLLALNILSCEINQIPILDVAPLINLEYLDCSTNQIASLDVVPLTNLTHLGCARNLLPQIDLSTVVNLNTLYVGNTELSAIDLSQLSSLQTFFLFDYQPGTIDLANLSNLLNVGFYFTAITTLDLSDKPLITNLNLQDNSLLESINIKNGGSIPSPFVANCPNLTFVCANENDVASVTQQITNVGGNNPNVVVVSYCSFTPGGNFNTITGSIKFDGENNGCDAGDGTFSNIRVNINDGFTNGGAFTTEDGNYNFYTEAGSFTLTPSMENPDWFNFTPATATVEFADDNNNVTVQDFCLTPNGVHPDVEVYLGSAPARPGFDSMYYIGYRNKGNQLLSGTASFVYDDTVLDYVSSTVVPDSQTAGTLSWDYSDLMPFESRYFWVTLNVNTPLETPPVNSGDVLTVTASVTATIGDDIPADNQFTYLQPVVNSCDPNDKYCMQGETVSTDEIGNFLTYLINFENIGTATAINVVVEDLIDATKFDISTLQVLGTSHPVDVRISENLVTFIFESINLAIGGHGNILLKIKTKNTLAAGDEVINMANIFFDYNAPIETNDARTIFQNLGIDDPNYDASISIYPNPTNDIVNIKAASDIKSVQLFDVQGRLLQTAIVNDSNATIDISSKQSGIYFLKITSENGLKTEKILKK